MSYGRDSEASRPRLSTIQPSGCVAMLRISRSLLLVSSGLLFAACSSASNGDNSQPVGGDDSGTGGTDTAPPQCTAGTACNNADGNPGICQADGSCSCTDGDFVARHKFRRPISERVFTRDHRSVFKMAANVFRKLRNGRIAARGFLAHRHQDDVVEVAAQ